MTLHPFHAAKKTFTPPGEKRNVRGFHRPLHYAVKRGPPWAPVRLVPVLLPQTSRARIPVKPYFSQCSAWAGLANFEEVSKQTTTEGGSSSASRAEQSEERGEFLPSSARKNREKKNAGLPDRRRSLLPSYYTAQAVPHARKKTTPYGMYVRDRNIAAGDFMTETAVLCSRDRKEVNGQSHSTLCAQQPLVACLPLPIHATCKRTENKGTRPPKFTRAKSKSVFTKPAKQKTTANRAYVRSGKIVQTTKYMPESLYAHTSHHHQQPFTRALLRLCTQPNGPHEVIVM